VLEKPVASEAVRVAGFLDAALGLGETARAIRAALETAGIGVESRVHAKPDATPPDLGFPAGRPESDVPGVTILSLNGEHFSDFDRDGGRAMLERDFVVAVWFWETEILPDPIAEGFRYIDEAWAASPFVRDVLESRAGEVPVRLFPHPVIPASGTDEEARDRFPFDSRFVYLFSFDYHSCMRRKNPDAVCRAFTLAFPEASADGPLCVIKSINGTAHPMERRLLEHRWAHRPDIVFLDSYLSASDRDLLLRRADSFVSFHRAEGLGLGLLEAMALGKPCAATAYSGNLDFMNEGNSWLVPGQRVPIGTGSLHYPADHFWYEIDIHSAARALREIHDDRDHARRVGERAQAEVLGRHGLAASGSALRSLIEGCRSRAPRPKSLPSGSRNHRADAYQALAALREIENTLRTSGRPRERGTSSRPIADALRLQRRALSSALKSGKENEARLQRRVDDLHAQLMRLESCVLDWVDRRNQPS